MNATAYQPQRLDRWTRPQFYIGADWPEMYVFLAQTRDSDSVTRSNFIVGLDELGGESETVLVIRESHFLCGWVEWIGINESDSDALTKADEMMARLENYPVLSDDHLGELEHDEMYDYWERASLSERIHLCHSAGVSIFAARHDAIENDRLYQYMIDS